MPSLGIAPRPGSCLGRAGIPKQSTASVSSVFPADGILRLLEIRHKIANARTDRVPGHIREQLTDDDGRPVVLLDSVTRAQYGGLIQDLLDETLAGCDKSKGCELIPLRRA
jgi:hypothetical protein